MTKFKYFDSVIGTMNNKNTKRGHERLKNKTKKERAYYYEYMDLLSSDLTIQDKKMLKHFALKEKEWQIKKTKIDAHFRTGTWKYSPSAVEEEEFVAKVKNMDYGNPINITLSNKGSTLVATDINCLNDEDYADKDGWF